MDLLIDIGNTRIKWATLTSQGIGAQAAATHAGWSSQQLVDVVLHSASAPDRVFVSNVGGTRMADLLAEALHARWQLAPVFVSTSPQACGVRNGYADHRKLGVDRWLGVIAAHAMQPRATCVVNVGTAMTIDGVTADGVHLGGVIVPGPDLMVSSLMRNTSDIMRHAEQGMVAERLFADNTLGAVHQGAVNALAALADRAIEAMRPASPELPVLLLTGGASERLRHLITAPCSVVPDLVLRGLAVVASTPGSATS